MEVLDLARLQFAATTVYHYLFVPLTLGLSLIIAGMQTVYVRTGNEEYKHMAKFWGKLFLINFAMGVVTGIVQEFQFGMGWSEYSRFVGDIFGAPLAVEALMAFFVESTFLGLWIFGWDRLSKPLHLGTIWMVAIASNISALWILIANAWMQNPVGYELVESETIALGYRAQMVDFGALVTNPSLLHMYPHVFFAGLSTGAIFVTAISAFHLLRKDGRFRSMFQKSFNIGLVVGTVAILASMIAGHTQGQYAVEAQPMKLAAMEGIFETEDPAGLSMFQIRSWDMEEEIINIRIPSLLSFLSYNAFDGEVRGLNPLQEEMRAEYAMYAEQRYADNPELAALYSDQANFIPPVPITYWSFRAMVGAGMLIFAAGLLGLWYVRKGTLLQRRWYLRLSVALIAFPFIANSTGWLITELGRQPWIVYGLQRVEEAVSPNLTVTDLWISLIVFVVLYGVLAIAAVYLLQKYARMGPETGELVDAPAAQPEAGTALEGAI